MVLPELRAPRTVSICSLSPKFATFFRRSNSGLFMSSQPSIATKPLEEALDLTEAVQEVVRQSADELLVINAVIKQELPDHVQVGEVAEALQKTDQIEIRINESAADLAHVNQLLEQEIDERADVERELAATKAALAEAQNASSAN